MSLNRGFNFLANHGSASAKETVPEQYTVLQEGSSGVHLVGSKHVQALQQLPFQAESRQMQARSRSGTLCCELWRL